MARQKTKKNAWEEVGSSAQSEADLQRHRLGAAPRRCAHLAAAGMRGVCPAASWLHTVRGRRQMLPPCSQPANIFVSLLAVGTLQNSALWSLDRLVFTANEHRVRLRDALLLPFCCWCGVCSIQTSIHAWPNQLYLRPDKLND